ncbi:hypothetical protein EMN47_18945 [Prolixibacteraceae bacterium JC049]|nr:hypothetical protein [Prolixibacteraceae bacterium JC049]
MRGTFTILGLLISALLISCSSDKNADILKADWSGIDLSSMNYKVGDYVYLKDSNYFYSGIILDFDKDSAGIWVGICFTSYKDTIRPDLKTLKDFKLFGRQIPSGLINTICIDCFDLAYLNERGFKSDTSKIGLIGSADYDKEVVRVGAVSPSYDLKGLINFYNLGVLERQKAPGDCKDSKFKIDAVREKYFPFEMIEKQKIQELNNR